MAEMASLFSGVSKNYLMKAIPYGEKVSLRKRTTELPARRHTEESAFQAYKLFKDQ